MLLAGESRGGCTATVAHYASMEKYATSPCNVQISALPLLDPLVPGRMESMPNRLAFVPQFGTSLSNNMVSASCFGRRSSARNSAPGGRSSVGLYALGKACSRGSHAMPEAVLATQNVSGHA